MAAARSVTCTPSLHDALPICTSLASVVLLMTSLGLGDVEAFPFVEPPANRAITDGVRLLDELGAIEDAPGEPGGRRRTRIGRSLARFPLDPRMARVLIEADRQIGRAHG